jgi:uncharacterized protein (TIGR03437 family)
VFDPTPGGGVSNALTFTVTNTGNLPTEPTVNTGGTVNGASFAPGAPVAPGSIVSSFGTGLASLSVSGSPGGNVTAQLNGIAAFIFDDFPSQINLQIPWELAGQSQASLTATVDGVTSAPVTVPLAAFAPGIFTIGSAGQGAILIASSGEVVAPVGSIPGRAARPAKRGEFITIFGTGFGTVTNQPASGVKASGTPLSVTTTTPTVTIGGMPATATDGFFSGLAPGFIGLYQINVPVPLNSPTGDAVPLAVNFGGAMSNTVTIAVQ